MAEKAEKAEKASVHPVNEMLPIGKLLAYGLQHVLAMYAGAVTVPIVIGSSFGLTSEQVVFLISADLFTCGIATLIQTIGFWKFGIRLPLIQGVTFACVQPIIALGLSVEGAGGTPELTLVVVFMAVAISGLFTLLIAPVFSKFIHFFPPIVTGTVILAIGLSLLPVSINMIGGQGFYVDGAPAEFGTPSFLLVGFLVVVTILVGNRFFKGFLKNISVLIGMVVGLIASIPFGFIDFAEVAKASIFRIDLPLGLNMPGLADGEYFRMFQSEGFFTHIIPAIISMCVVMLIVMVESTGDYIAIGEIIEVEVDEKKIAAGLRADGLSTMIGGFLNALPYTAFAQNVGLVALTGVRSRFVVATSGIILVFLGLIPKLAAIFDALPPFVIGGAGFVMFATVAANGIKTLSKADLKDRPNNIFVVAISIAIGLIPTVSSGLFGSFPASVGPLMSSGISLTALTAVLLNIFFNGVKKGIKPDMTEAH